MEKPITIEIIENSHNYLEEHLGTIKINGKEYLIPFFGVVATIKGNYFSIKMACPKIDELESGEWLQYGEFYIRKESIKKPKGLVKLIKDADWNIEFSLDVLYKHPEKCSYAQLTIQSAANSPRRDVIYSNLNRKE